MSHQITVTKFKRYLYNLQNLSVQAANHMLTKLIQLNARKLNNGLSYEIQEIREI